MLQYCPALVLHLHRGGTTHSFLAGDVVQLLPEALLLVMLNYDSYPPDGILLILLLCYFQSIIKMLPAKALPMLLVELAFLLARCESLQYLCDCCIEWV